MAISLQFYADAQLTQPLATSQFTIDREIGGAPFDKRVFLGSPNTGRRFDAADNGPIVVSIQDAAPTSGFAAADIALATDIAGLDTAVPGDPLTINGYILSGVANARAVWIRFSGTSAQPMTSDDIALLTNTIRETAV